MKAWFLLAGAILTEVTGSLSLKAALDQPTWYALVVTGYLASFLFLAGVLHQGMPLGVAYGIWGATGVALTAVLSALLYGEAFTSLMAIGLVLIMSGVFIVEFGSQRAAERTGGS